MSRQKRLSGLLLNNTNWYGQLMTELGLSLGFA